MQSHGKTASFRVRAKGIKPHRVVRRRTKNWKMPENTVYVGRPTVWGNPFVVGAELIGGKKLTAAKAVALYRQVAQPMRLTSAICVLAFAAKISPAGVRSGSPATLDVLLELANSS